MVSYPRSLRISAQLADHSDMFPSLLVAFLGVQTVVTEGVDRHNESFSDFLTSLTRLSDHLMKDYRRELPAVYTRVSDRYDSAKRTQQFKMTLMYAKLLDINEHEQSASMIAELYHEWTDSRLVWNPSNNDDIEALMINHNKIWVPDVMPVDLISYDKNLDPDRQNVLVASNGTVVYFVSIIIKFTCRIDVWAFPFDYQECRIRMGSRNFLTSEVDLIAELYERVTVEDMSNGEWQAIDFWTEPGPNIVDMYGWEYPVVSIVFRVRRNSNYYVHAMILPSFMLTVLVMFGIFWSPVDEKNYMERLSLGFAAKLAMLMVLQITSDNMPKSERIPILSFYIMASLVMITTAVIMALLMAKFLNHTDAIKRRECDQKRAENGELCATGGRYAADWLCTNAHSVCLFLFSGATIVNVALLLARGHLQH